MSFHTFGDSHAAIPWNGIPGAVPHHFGPVTCRTVGVHKHDLKNGMNISRSGLQAGETACFCYGEIDCRCHIRNLVTAEMTYQKVIDGIVNDYIIALMENEKTVPGVKMAIYNVVPPARIGSGNNPDYPFVGSNQERSAYSRYFNESLSWNCKELGWVFVDVYDKYVGEDGCLNPAYSDGHVHIVNPVFIIEFLKGIL